MKNANLVVLALVASLALSANAFASTGGAGSGSSATGGSTPTDYTPTHPSKVTLAPKGEACIGFTGKMDGRVEAPVAIPCVASNVQINHSSSIGY